MKVNDIREQFASLLSNKQFVAVNREASMTSIVGSRTLEIVGASFTADEEAIFGTVNRDYVEREERWYNSMSLNVYDIPSGPPEIWKRCADKDGFINSNYGYLIYHKDNGNQYDNVVMELKNNPESRRATMVYTRPNIWHDYNLNGRSDFICTTDVQYLIRDGKVQAVVRMRSNDAFAGYRNDYAWQKHVQEKVCTALSLPAGDITWQVGSLHIYERQFYLVDYYNQTGETTITKSRYRELFPTSPYSVELK